MDINLRVIHHSGTIFCLAEIRRINPISLSVCLCNPELLPIQLVGPRKVSVPNYTHYTVLLTRMSLNTGSVMNVIVNIWKGLTIHIKGVNHKHPKPLHVLDVVERPINGCGTGFPCMACNWGQNNQHNQFPEVITKETQTKKSRSHSSAVPVSLEILQQLFFWHFLVKY